MANTQYKGNPRHIAWLSSFLFKTQCFHRDENDIAPDDKYFIRGKRERFVVLATFWKNDNSSCFDIPIVSTESQVLYSFIIKVRMDPHFFIFLSSLIALYTNSTYIIWLKKYSVVFYFLNF